MTLKAKLIEWLNLKLNGFWMVPTGWLILESLRSCWELLFNCCFCFPEFVTIGITVNNPWYAYNPIILQLGSITESTPNSAGLPTRYLKFPVASEINFWFSTSYDRTKYWYRAVATKRRSVVHPYNKLKSIIVLKIRKFYQRL